MLPLRPPTGSDLRGSITSVPGPDRVKTQFSKYWREIFSVYCNHDNAPGAALAEASCTDGGCGFMGHVTDCNYGINGEISW